MFVGLCKTTATHRHATINTSLFKVHHMQHPEMHMYSSPSYIISEAVLLISLTINSVYITFMKKCSD